jgi:hypothetical protein
MEKLDLGFQWDATAERNGERGAYCLPQPGLTSYASRTHTSFGHTQADVGNLDTARDVEQFISVVQNSLDSARFLALSVRPSRWLRAKERLQGTFDFQVISFDELLLRHLHQLCDSMHKPPKWEVVLKADAAEPNSVDWSRLQRLVRKVLPNMADEIKQAGGPVLLTEPGLMARYDLVNSWLSDLRQTLLNAQQAHALVLLIANDASTPSAVIDGVSVPSGAGSREFARIPNAWLLPPPADKQADKEHAGSQRKTDTNPGTMNL